MWYIYTIFFFFKERRAPKTTDNNGSISKCIFRWKEVRKTCLYVYIYIYIYTDATRFYLQTIPQNANKPVVTEMYQGLPEEINTADKEAFEGDRNICYLDCGGFTYYTPTYQ